MNEYALSLKQTLTSLIREMSAAPAPYVKNPETNFTRKKKLPFETVMELLISMGGNSIYKELLESQGYDVNTATTSAFVQQRNKILPSAVEFLFHKFTKSYTDLKDYRGYRLLAIDGSDLHIATNAADTDTYFQSQPNAKGYNLLHLNAAYDLCNSLYVDAIVQPRRLCNEGRALAAMVDRSPIEGKTIVTADRGYESYNNFAHIERKGWNFVIRVKDLDSNGILSGLRLPSGGEFDIDVRQTLTKKQTNEVKAHPEIYKFLPFKATFDFLDLRENLFYPISFRVVRFVLPNDAYETVITNLSAADFPPDEIRSIYNMRWGIETSFRALKYTVGLTNFHAKKQESIIQEIFAKMIMYNFAEMITSHVVISQMDKRHPYQVNFTVAVYVCRQFLRSRNDEPPPDVEALIRKNILPIRPIHQGQKNTRKIRYKSAVSFVYRVA
ncbi:IS4 family transposase [Paenibacillus turpanensis]|uniref:IS4 family transposase n=1 Tax=Paenibacillus turpanensis TaxID=2689078 RepID=UPI00140E7C68|nr:IS4 family transposase [Paenibacillus turpanensis]